MSGLEKLFEIQVQTKDIPQPQREYRWAAMLVGEGKGIRGRLKMQNLKDWRFDFAWPDYKLALEIEGGGWINGGHNRGKHFASDIRKYFAAHMRGWLVIRVDGEMVKSGEAIKGIEDLFMRRRKL